MDTFGTNRPIKKIGFQAEKTYYDTLEIAPDATELQIRESYFRLKNAYSQESIALYSLLERDETDRLINDIEDAYQVLSNPDRRRQYDVSHGFVDRPKAESNSATGTVVSIDRVPPMDQESSEEDILVAPATDRSPFESNEDSPFGDHEEDLEGMLDAPTTDHQNEKPQIATPFQDPETVPQQPLSMIEPRLYQTEPSQPEPPKAIEESARRDPFRPDSMDSSSSRAHSFNETPTNTPSRSSRPADPLAHLKSRLENETEWPGELLKKVREAQEITLEDLAEHTKVSKNYLRAIEAEDFGRLPAAVYLRGFLIQIGKRLGLDSEQIVKPFLKRYKEACPEKF